MQFIVNHFDAQLWQGSKTLYASNTAYLALLLPSCTMLWQNGQPFKRDARENGFWHQHTGTGFGTLAQFPLCSRPVHCNLCANKQIKENWLTGTRRVAAGTEHKLGSPYWGTSVSANGHEYFCEEQDDAIKIIVMA